MHIHTLTTEHDSTEHAIRLLQNVLKKPVYNQATEHLKHQKSNKNVDRYRVNDQQVR